MLTIDEIRRAERELNALYARARQAAYVRARSREHRQAWEAAGAAIRAYRHPVLDLSDPSVLQQIRAGDAARRHEALLFLEADPWFFRSGYMKEKLLRALRRGTFLERETYQITRILLAVVDSRGRREFREYCRLAARHVTPGLREGLLERAHSPDEKVRSRAAEMLRYLK